MHDEGYLAYILGDADAVIGDGYSLYQGDCLDVMASLNPQSVDLCLTDPPYGTTACKWDSVIPFEPMWEGIKRVVKVTAPVVLFGSEPFSSYLRISNVKEYRYSWIWHKNKSGNVFQYKNSPMKRHENIDMFSSIGIAAQCVQPYHPELSPTSKMVRTSYTEGRDYVQGFNKTKPYEMTQTGYPESVLKFDVDAKRVHPTQKPVALLEYLIRTYTDEGDTVLDFTMGGGSTGVAAMNTGRKFIGIELDPGYFDIACKRIQEAHSVKS